MSFSIQDWLLPAAITLALIGLTAATWGGPAMVGDVLWPTVALPLWGCGVLATAFTGGLGRFRERALSRWPLWFLPAALFAAAAAGWASYSAGTLCLAVMVVALGARRPRIALAALALLAALVVTPLELFLLWARSSSAAARQPWLADLSRTFYTRFCEMPQFSRACSEFDPELLYRLRPGSCRFENEEYRTTITVNRLGVRGAEADLEAPEIIVLGDSYSMGWGVEDDETYAAELARRTGRRVLNLAVPSYGTARQLVMLGRADRSRADAIILQYCGNDLGENRDYAGRDFRPPAHTREEHEKWISSYERYRSYYPGKLTAFALWKVWDGVRSTVRADGRRPQTGGEDARLVRRLLEHHAERIGDALLVVFAISGPGRTLPDFGENLRRELAGSDAGLRVEIVEIEPKLGPELFYDLDPHLNPAGHQAVATQLEPFLTRRDEVAR